MQLSKGLKKYTSNTLWLLSERAIQMILTFVVGVMVARYMSEEEYGFFSYAGSLVVIFSIFSNLGLSAVIVKKIVNGGNKNLLLGSSFIIKFIGSLIGIGSILLIAYVMNNSSSELLLILLFSIPISIKSFDVVNYFYEAKVLSKYTVKARLVGVIVNNILKVIVITLGLSTHFIYPIFIIDALIYISLLHIFYKNQGQFVKNWKVEKETVSSLVKTSWPLMLSALIVTLYLQIDQIMIVQLLGKGENGVYAAATKLSVAFYSIPWIISSSVFPAIVNARKKSYEFFKLRYSYLVQFLMLLGLLLSLFIFVLAPFIIDIIYGGKYLGADYILQIHIWASIFVFIGYAASKWLVVEQKEKYALINNGAGAILNISLNIFLIPKYGIIGAAYATLCSQFFAHLLMPCFFRETRSLFYLQIISLFKSITIYIPIKNFINLLKNK